MAAIPTTINPANNGTILPTMDPTNCDHTGYCVNGASCTAHDIRFKICTCLVGFHGPRCERIVLTFEVSDDKTPPDEEWKNSIAVWISVACLVAIFVLALALVAWRTCSKDENRRRWKRWQQSNPSSGDNMESFTIATNDQSSQPRKLWAFGLAFMKRNQTPKAKGCDNQAEKNWNNQSTNKPTVLPNNNSCKVADGQVTICVDNDKISVQTHPKPEESKQLQNENSTPLEPNPPNYNSIDIKDTKKSSFQSYVNETLDV